jgi:Probable Zinc-ribbon domain
MIPDQNVTMKWNGKNKKFYIDKGYNFTKLGDTFFVNIKDLSINSHYHVTFVCDYCMGINQIKDSDKKAIYKNLLKRRQKTEHDCCNSPDCKSKKIHQSFIKNLKENSSTLGDKFPHVSLLWSERNLDTPYDYSHSSGRKVWWKCEKGHEWEESISKIAVLGRGCPYCAGRKVCKENSLAEIYPEIASEWNYTKNIKLTPFKVTKSSGKIVWWFCKNCNHEWTASISNRINGQGCPKCCESKGEKRINKFLVENSVKFKSQYTFKELKGLKNKHPLKFDFAIFDEKNILTQLIEYDGEQHFKEARYSRNKDKMKEKLLLIQSHDQMKNYFCIEKNIPLLRINYIDFQNIESILESKLITYIHIK